MACSFPYFSGRKIEKLKEAAEDKRLMEEYAVSDSLSHSKQMHMVDHSLYRIYFPQQKKLEREEYERANAFKVSENKRYILNFDDDGGKSLIDTLLYLLLDLCTETRGKDGEVRGKMG